MVPGVEPIWIAFDRREQRIQTAGWGKQRFKKLKQPQNTNIYPHQSSNLSTLIN